MVTRLVVSQLGLSASAEAVRQRAIEPRPNKIAASRRVRLSLFSALVTGGLAEPYFLALERVGNPLVFSLFFATRRERVPKELQKISLLLLPPVAGLSLLNYLEGRRHLLQLDQRL